MDGKAKLPDVTEEIEWQGLEALYSVNESLYRPRNDYRLSPDDWTNYLKDVDRIFALLNNYSEQNGRAKPQTSHGNEYLDESSTGVALLEMSSAESAEGSSSLIAQEEQPIMPTDFGSLALRTVMLRQESKLELSNDIPEKQSLNPTHWNKQAKLWLEAEEPVSFEMGFSGNDLTELEARHSFILQPVSLQKDSFPDSNSAEDIFEEQSFLPMNSVEPMLHVIVTEHKMEKELKTRERFPEKSSKLPSVEGSASSSLSSY